MAYRASSELCHWPEDALLEVMAMDVYSSIKFHRALVNDRRRTDLYRRAVLSTVRGGDVVLDLGTGSGILAFFACQAGARHVYAVDRTDIVGVAREISHDNGFADRITCIKGDARWIDLPEPVDLITSELISESVFGQGMEDLVNLARTRHLKPSGRFIPRSVQLWVAPVEAPDAYASLEFPSKEVYGLDFSAARRVALNRVDSGRFREEHLVSDPQVAYNADFTGLRKPQAVSVQMEFAASRSAVLSGFAGWFSAVLADNIVLESFPAELSAWDNAFFPIPEPAQLRPGTIVKLRLECAHPSGVRPVWRWVTTITGAPGAECESQPLARHDQSTFSGWPLSKDTILRRSRENRPLLSPLGRQVRSILLWCDGSLTVAQMEEQLLAEYPGSFKCREEAAQFIQTALLGQWQSGNLS